ncbi:MAG: hypothetical protein MJ069_09665 [Salinivirgaceae bacterium]|nr:hypothetical protein [Salinivirgaceae bacterium]
MQSQELGPTYFTRVMVPSFISALRDTDKNSYDHDWFWVERDANKRAYSYFIKEGAITYEGWNYERNPIDVNYKWQEGIDNSDNKEILNKIMQNHWYNYLFGL